MALTRPDVAPEVLAAACVQLAGHMAGLSGWQLQDQAACTAKHCSRVLVVVCGTDKQLLMDVKTCLYQAAKKPLLTGLACQLENLLQQQ